VIQLDKEFHGATSVTLTKFEMSEECAIGSKVPIISKPGLTMATGAQAVEFPASLSGTVYMVSETTEHKATLTNTSTWKLTGTYAGSKFGYE
jgi:hypothetical protein